MRKIIDTVIWLLHSPVFVCSGIVGISLFSLAAALTAQYAFGLLPCILCIYQRVPFVIASVLGLIGFGLSFKKPKFVPFIVMLCAVVFMANSFIAFYHTGVELHWWTSSIDGCSSPDFSAEEPVDLLSAIESTPAVYCDVIPWADPVLNLSMANYNTIMCFGLAIGCVLCFFLIRRNNKRKEYENTHGNRLAWRY